MPFFGVWVAAGIMIVGAVWAASYSAARRRRETKYFIELAQRDGFKTIDSDSYISKSNRFGDIINEDFLSSEIDSVKMTRGLIKYSPDETVLFCDCVMKSGVSGKQPGSFVCSALLHLRNTTFERRLKFRRRYEGAPQPRGQLVDLGFACEGEGDFFKDFLVSADSQISSDTIPGQLRDVLVDLKDEFPLRSPEFKGAVAIAAKGWLILTMTGINKEMFDSLSELDKRIAACVVREDA